MSVNDSPQSKQLNPFAFPSETDTRFTLFIFAVLLVAYSSGFIAMIALNPNQADPFEGIAPPNVQIGDIKFFEEYRAYYLKQIKAASISLIFPVGLAAAIFILATILYRLHPPWLRRQKHLEPFREDQDPLLSREVRSIAHEVGISPIPTIMLGSNMSSQNAQAFGFPGQYSLRLESGLRLLVRKSPGAFRAIVLHELAHIFNRDIGRAYYAQSIWRAALLLTILPLASILVLVSLHSNFTRLLNDEFSLYRLLAINLPTVMVYLLKLAAIIFIAAAVRAGLLRVREKYADVRAASWGASDSLQALLKRTGAQEKTQRGLHWLRLHPTAQERLNTLLNPAYECRVSKDVAFTVGAMIAVTVMEVFILTIFAVPGIRATTNYVTSLFGDVAFTNLPPMSRSFSVGVAWLIWIGGSLLLAILVALVFFSIAYLISNTVGLEVQRESLADITMNRAGAVGYLRLGLPAMLMAIGVESGFLIAPSPLSGLGAIFALDPPSFFSARGLIPTFLTIPEFLMAAGLFWLWLVYARFLGQRVLGSWAGSNSPKWRRHAMTLVLSLLWWVLFLPVGAMHAIIVGIGIRAIPVDQLAEFTPLMLFALIICLLISLLAYVILLGMSWALLKFTRLIWSPRCPACGHITRHEIVIGKKCDRCNSDLAPWLFMKQQVAPVSETLRSG